VNKLIQQKSIWSWNEKQGFQQREDFISAEEPLEVLLEYGCISNRQRVSLALLMRSPGDDLELGYGFLYSEDIIQQASDVIGSEASEATDEGGSVVDRMLYSLRPDLTLDLNLLERNFLSSTSCGLCGKKSWDQVAGTTVSFADPTKWSRVAIQKALQWLESEPDGHRLTGSLHSSLLINVEGDWISGKEDVGRHNALDKLIGAALLQGSLPLHRHMLVLSGRISFELVQKAVRAGVFTILAKGAPSSAAIDLAGQEGATLIGFARADRFNVYTCPDRIF